MQAIRILSLDGTNTAAAFARGIPPQAVRAQRPADVETRDYSV